MKTIKIMFCSMIMLVFSCSKPEKSNIKGEEQEEISQQVTIPDFFGRNSQKPEVLLLGVFHFQDAGADDYKPKYSVNILSKKRQKELDYILDAFEKYRPTKIIIEARVEQQGIIDSLYSEYLNDRFELRANEIFQIGFKLGKRLGIKQLIASDVRGREYDYIVEDYEAYKQRKQEIVDEEGLEERLDSDYGNRYSQLYEYLDSLKTVMTLGDFLLLQNEDSMLSLKHGHYLLGSIGVNNGKEYPSADNLSGWWYNRNLRIVSNIRKSIENPDDRVLVIFGAGHMPIIKHALEASPEINVVELKEVLQSSN